MRAKKAFIVAIMLLVVGAVMVSATDVLAQRGGRPGAPGLTGAFQYVIKFACGQVFKDRDFNWSHQLPAAPGQYYTDINVHNPNDLVVKAHKKVAKDGDKAQKHGPVTSPVPFVLNPDEALQITCADIREMLSEPYPYSREPPVPNQFIKGFVVILTRHRLDITAIYSVCPPQPITTGMTLDLGCPGSFITLPAPGSVSSIDVVYITEPSPVAAPERLLPQSVTTAQLSLSGEFKLDVNARWMLGLEGTRLQIYNINGQLLHDTGFTWATQLSWNALEALDRPLANGVYFYVVQARDVFGRVGIHVGKFVVLR